jgi:hypothetical protein
MLGGIGATPDGDIMGPSIILTLIIIAHIIIGPTIIPDITPLITAGVTPIHLFILREAREFISAPRGSASALGLVGKRKFDFIPPNREGTSLFT